MMTRGAMFKERENYIKTLAQLLSAFPTFGDLKYARVSKTEGEYLRLTDIFGKSCFLNITSMPLKDVYKDVSYIVSFGRVPQSIITDESILMTIAKYFR